METITKKEAVKELAKVTVRVLQATQKTLQIAQDLQNAEAPRELIDHVIEAGAAATFDCAIEDIKKVVDKIYEGC